MYPSSAIRVLAAGLLLAASAAAPAADALPPSTLDFTKLIPQTILSLAALPTKATESFLVIIPLAKP